MHIPHAGRSPAELALIRQQIVNARPIPPLHLQHTNRAPIPVVARVIWERDGEDRVTTDALDWVGRDVLVELRDARWQTHGLWLDAADVRRA